MNAIVSSFKSRLSRFAAWEYSGLCLLVILVLALHLATIMQPASQVFDEQYYVPDAVSILNGDGSARIEHPPLGKLIIAGSIAVFGDNPFGWRIMPVISGLACIVLFYLICRRLSLSRRASFLAAFLLALENLSFVQASIAMLDVFSMAFALAAFYVYLKKQYPLAGVMLALAALSKITGALALGVIALHWLIASRKDALRFILSMTMAPVLFLALMPLMNLAVWGAWHNPFDDLLAMYRAASLATFSAYPDPMLSRPWEWLFKPIIITYWVKPHYVGMISPGLWALVIPSMLYAGWKAVKKNAAAIFSCAWFAVMYLLWIPVSLVTDRISYVYYFYPAIGAVCLAMGVWAEEVWREWKGRAGRLAGGFITLFVLFHLGVFVVLCPAGWWGKVPLCAGLFAVFRAGMGDKA
jgi:predicted membrane-bound dolichyl-phosphate-mannose-protein mannosyltransferase